MFRTIRKIIVLSVLGGAVVALISVTPHAIGSLIGYVLFGYLLVAAWPRLRRDTAWLRSKMLGTPGARTRSARGAVGGL